MFLFHGTTVLIRSSLPKALDWTIFLFKKMVRILLPDLCKEIAIGISGNIPLSRLALFLGTKVHSPAQEKDA
jgi:hypothetical protein